MSFAKLPGKWNGFDDVRESGGLNIGGKGKGKGREGVDGKVDMARDYQASPKCCLSTATEPYSIRQEVFTSKV